MMSFKFKGIAVAVVAAVLLRSSALYAGLSTGDELSIANRYFAARKAERTASPRGRMDSRLAINPETAPSAAGTVEKLNSQGYHPGQSWTVELQLMKPPLLTPEPGFSEKIQVRYHVLSWSGFATGELRLKVEKVGSPDDGFLEQEIGLRTQAQRLRRCDALGACGAWSNVNPETLRVAGEDSGMGWEHAPTLLPLASILRAKLSTGKSSGTGEDFFGRRFEWSWRAGDPWPDRMSSPQGIARLVEGGSQ